MGNYYLYKIGAYIIRSLPLPASYALSVFLADCQYLISPADRKAVEANLKVIANTKEVPASMVREVFRNFGRYLVDFFTMTKIVNKNFLKSCVHISGIEYINEALQKGKGGIFISAHVGNWEMAGAVVSLLEYPVSVVALSHKDKRVNAFFNQQREFFGTAVIQTDVAVRRCLEQLKRNRLIALLTDRDFSNHGIVMDFLGRKAFIPKGAALFSLKTGAPLLPTFFLRTAGNQFQFTISKPIYPPLINKETHITDDIVQDYIQSYLKKIEDQIRETPCQWLMFRRFDIV